MARPVDISKFTEGPRCPKCFGTLYRRKTICVECERRSNARRYAERTGKEYVEPAPRPLMSAERLATAIDYYQRGPSALQRGARLDALVRARFAALLGDTPAPDVKPLTGGEQYLASLPRGYHGPQLTEATIKAQRAAALTPLVEAVEAIYSGLPDLVSVQDVADLLDPALVEAAKYRYLRAIADTLKRLGAASRQAGISKDRTVTQIYIVRRPDRYAGLRGRAMFAAYQAIKAGTRSGQPTVAVGRPSARRAVGRRAAPIVNAAPGQTRKTSHSRRING
jgi:hypothetical protein